MTWTNMQWMPSLLLSLLPKSSEYAPMNLVSIAIVLGPHPLSVLEQGEVLVQQLNAIFPEGQVAITTTGDGLRQRYAELSPSRQQEVGVIILTTTIQAANIARDVLKATIEEREAEQSAGFIAAMLIIAAFICALLVAIYVFSDLPLLPKGSILAEQRRLNAQYVQRGFVA